MAEQPYIKWWTSDFLNGVADLAADEIGVYAVILSLIADRGGPIPDDPQWLARRSGTTTRGVNRICARLIELGKIEKRGALIGNRRMLIEVRERDKKSNQASEAAKAKWAKWHEEKSPSLPFEEENGEKTDEKSPEKPGKNRQKKLAVKSKKSQKSDDPDVRTHVLPSRARARPEPEIESTNQTDGKTLEGGEVDCSAGDDHEDGPGQQTAPPPPPTGGQERPVAPLAGVAEEPAPATPTLGDADLKTTMDECCAAAGFYPRSPVAIIRELDLVKEWRKLGVDFDAVVMPTIRAVIAKTSEPTGSLLRFDRQVRLEHAKHGATPASRAAYRAPASPIVEQPGEEECMAPLRADLLERLGPKTFARYANHVLFESLDQGGQRILRVTDQRPPSMALMDGERSAIVRAVAKRHGFDTVW